MSLRKQLLRCVLFLMCLGLSVLEAAATPLNDYKHKLVEYYGVVGFHPLLLPQGHRVGDVIDIEDLAVVWEQEKCFPDLETEESNGNVSLPFVMQLENEAAGFWVQLKYFLGIELNADETRQIMLNLEDVSVESASLDSLQSALAEQCSELLPIFEDDDMPRVMDRHVNIIAAVLKGRANTVFSYSGELQVEAAFTNLAHLLPGNAAPQLRKLTPELAALYGLSGRTNVIDVSERVQTVAYRPATIFDPRLAAKASGEIEVEPFDPENALHREFLGLLALEWAASDVEN